MFQCSKCFKSWKSAHAFKRYTQSCKKCEEKMLPKFMWVNSNIRTKADREIKKNDGPHDSARCEACANGKCFAGNRIEWSSCSDEE
mmetsp:Transcript_18136/g.32496  ORF Transcript_18136/g.32496 Transcript_18136/m.32496 type:complete len:86 (+) Transcript_18136:572-829(+)